MKIGIWLDEPIHKNSGGVFTYIHTLINGIDNFKFDPAIEIIFLAKQKPSGLNSTSININEQKQRISVFTKIFRKLLKLLSKNFFNNSIVRIDQNEKKIADASIANYLKNQNIRFIFYPTQASSVINGIPYILNNWDLAHHTTYAFPEITDDNGFNRRNDWYTNVMPSSLMIMSETTAGKKELTHYLNLNPDKIKVLPIFSSDGLKKLNLTANDQVAILNDLNLKAQKFFFYPAQFWAHKNHYTLIKAFKKFIANNPDFKLFFCGSNKGNMAYLKQYVNDLALNKNVIFSDFISDEALHTLYKNAMALVMPTFLGPSNIPPIEALHLNCPVLCSDLEGHREIMQGAALYFNPANDLAILESMEAIINPETRLTILQNQKKLASITPHTIEKALIKLNENFMEALNIRNCWE